MKISLRGFVALIATTIAMGIGENANAQTLLHEEDFTANQIALFDFGAYSGNFEFTPEGIDIDIPASGDSFGGLGVAPLASAAPVSLEGVETLQVTARLDDGNGSDLVLSIRESDDAGGEGEFFSFTIAQSEFTPGEFVTVAIAADSFGFNGDNGGDTSAGNTEDGILNGILNNTGIQSPFGGTASQNFTIQSVAFFGATAVPEPSSAALLGLCGLGFFSRRRRG